MKLLVDAHLDLAYNALLWDRDLRAPLEQVRAAEKGMSDHPARGRSTVSLPQMRRAGAAMCLGTVICRVKPQPRPKTGYRRTDLDVMTADISCAYARGHLAYYRLLEQAGEIRMIRTSGDLRVHWSMWEAATPATRCSLPVGLILAMEGADPIVSISQADEWWNDGLRTVGLAHYGNSNYAAGTGGVGGLTPKGFELLAQLSRLGMILDLTHSSDASFSQALDAFEGPVLASHNNCRALVPGQRQFTDEQIRLLVARDAVIGVALDAWMLQDGYVIGESRGDAVPLEAVVDHIDHICQIAGNTRHAAIGSDLDGGFGTNQTPAGFDTIADLQKLEPIFRKRGYGDDQIAGFFHGNWLRFFLQNLPDR